MNMTLNNVTVYEQNTVKINNIYIDPYRIKDASHDAEIIFITHSHYDHLSMEDLKKVKNAEKEKKNLLK